MSLVFLGKKITLTLNSYLYNCLNGTSLLCLPDIVSATTDGNKHESHACVSVDSATALPTHIVKPANDSVIFNSKANQSALGNKRKNTEKGSGLEEINNLSPKKKRQAYELYLLQIILFTHAFLRINLFASFQDKYNGQR